MIKALIKRKLISLSVVEKLKINTQNFIKNPPIIIYQMGKVGSSTVLNSLKNVDLPNPVHHVHFLSHNGIKNAEKYFLRLKNPIIPHHIKLSKILRKKIDKTKDRRWKIITLIREPIGRDISDFFENVETQHPNLIDENGNVKKSQAIEFLQKKFMNYDELTNYTCTWFDKELKIAFNIDIYAYPFNHRKGFTIIRNKNIEILILKLEDIDRSFNNGVKEFLNLNCYIKMLKANVAKDKKYSIAYKYVLKNIVIPKPVCIKIYSSKYANHFYSESMRSEFIKKWCRKNF